jgi:molybdopterin-guanine dinucleotide biosynthesis protein A
MTREISGAILAGGSGSRFGGKIKSKLIIHGETIISRILHTIDGVFEEKIIVTNSPEEFREFTSCKIAGDRVYNAGPLAGIHASLSETASDAIFIFAGDMPFLDEKIISLMISEFSLRNCDALVPAVGLDIEPLHSIYRKSVLSSLEGFLLEGKSNAIRDFLACINAYYLNLPYSEDIKRAFTNINSPADLDHLYV